MRNQFLLPAALLLAAVLPGCTGLPADVAGRINGGERQAARMVREVGQVEARGQSASSVVRQNGMWIGHTTIKRAAAPLPPLFSENATFDRSVRSLAEFAERITVRSGIPARVSADAVAVAARGAAPAGGGAGAAGAVTAMATLGAASGAGMAGAAGAEPVRIVYPSGSFQGLLDTAAARFGVSWKYADGAIQFFHTDTRTFQINAIPGDASFNASVSSNANNEGGSGGGGGSGGESGGGVSSANVQNTAVKSELSVFGSLEKTVTIMLTPAGKVIASPATGTLTVTDTPAALERIGAYLEAQNKALSRQVMVNVTVLAVTLDRGDNYGIKWDLLYQTLENRYQIHNSLGSSSAGGGSSLTAGILSGTSRWGGSEVIINALSEQGQVRRETTASVVTLNNQPVPIQVARQTAYLKSSQTTLTADVGSTTSLTPGTVTSGFNMSILPHLLDNGTVMLQFSTDISSLVRLETVSGGTGANSSVIQTPEIDTRNFLQRVAMKSNETLIISGFEQTDDNLDRSGVGHPGNFLLGGGARARAGKEIIVILVTPVTMEGA